MAMIRGVRAWLLSAGRSLSNRRICFVRRIAGGLLAFFVLTGTFLILPVYAAPVPQATPVAPSIDAVDMGSVDQPTDAAVVTDDGAVVDAGPAAPVDPPAAGQPEVTVPRSDRDQLASSGKEIEGVPALTVSRPRTDRFESVGVSWAEDPGVTEVSVQLRVRHKSGDWGKWTTVTQDDVALEAASKVRKPDVRGGTAPYWTGDGYGVEVIVQAPDGTTPRDVQVSLIDPGTSPADAAPGAPAVKDEAHAAMTMPAIYSRAQWAPTRPSWVGTRSTRRRSRRPRSTTPPTATATRPRTCPRSCVRSTPTTPSPAGGGTSATTPSSTSSAGRGKAERVVWPARSSGRTPVGSTPPPSASPCWATTTWSTRRRPCSTPWPG